MKKRQYSKIAGRILAAALAAGLALESPASVIAGTWTKDMFGWSFTDDSGTKVVGRWLSDNGNWYLIGQDGYMKTGWQMDNGKWYFLNTSATNATPEGAALKGWQWIDGKCYYFTQIGTETHAEGSMYVNETTPDGFTVNADGQWTENGSVVSISGKGILTSSGPAGSTTTTRVSSGGGGGGSSSGGGGSSSSSKKNTTVESAAASETENSTESVKETESSKETEKELEQETTKASEDVVETTKDSTESTTENVTESEKEKETESTTEAETEDSKEEDTEETGEYTIYYVDEKGNILKKDTKTGTYGKTVDIGKISIDGYDYVDGAGERVFTKGTTSFVVTYESKKSDADTDDDKKEMVSYRFVYVDKDTEEEIGVSDWSSVEEGKSVTWKEKTIKGYTLAAGNNLTRTVSVDKEEFTIYFEKSASISYSITWKTSGGDVIYKMTGTGKIGDTVSVSSIELPDYEFETMDDIILSENEEDNEYTLSCTPLSIASDSEITDYVKYTLTYKDFDTKETLHKEEGKVERDSDITPDFCPDGYEFAVDDYEFVASEDKNSFTVYLIKTEIDNEISTVSYNAFCEDEEANTIKEFSGSATIKGTEDVVTVEHAIDGYTQTGDTEFTMSVDSDNFITLTYEKSKAENYMEYTVRLVDISTMQLIREDTIDTYRGAYLDFTDYEAPDGYEPAGTFPSDIRVQAESTNNKITLYFTPIREVEETVEYANWTVKYVNYDDYSEEVLPSQTGRSEVGKFPVYFEKEFNKNGKTWRAVDSSPRTFTLKANTDMNVFIVRFKQTGTIEQEDTSRTYELRCVAKDTGSILGIQVGEGNVGDTVALRNSWSDYKYADASVSSYTIQSEDNVQDVYYARNTVEQPDKNEHTNDYDGYEFLAVFVDQYGEAVFDPVRGKVRDGDTFYIDYPDTIERDGVVYRADKKSPYKTSAGGTEYRQYEITYTKGESSDTKLSTWLQKAHEAKTDFWGTTPYRYAINLKEYGSWNDVGLYVGTAPKGSTVEINSVTVPGWNKRANEVNSFVLSDDNMTIVREYDKNSDTPSTNDYEREYTISFKDEDGNDLFEPYTGKAAFARLNQTIDFYVYFPRVFVDAEGNRWRTDETSPKAVTLRCNNDSDDNLHEIKYYKIYDNQKTEFIVTSDAEVRNFMSDIGSALYDTDLHDFYLIGKDYDPSTAVVSEVIYGYTLTGYQGAIEDTFELDGSTYKVFHFRFSRAFEEETCEHEWHYVEELPGNCYVTAQTTVECARCKATKTVYKGALGHIDYDYDRVCDVCGEQLSISVGDSITVNWDGKEYYGKTAALSFTCIGTDEDGNYILMSETNLTSDIFGDYAEDGKGYYSTSDLHSFLNDGFADGLSVKSNLVFKNGERVSILSEEEYNAYKAAAGNTYIFPDGNFILKSEDEDTVLTTKGTVDVADANNQNVRPVIYLPASDATVGAEGGSWSTDDLQARKIGDQVWLFRCVDENYEDSSATPKHLALFLCDTVIPSNYEMGFGIGATEDTEGRQETRFFSTTDNNYKYSTVASWLKENTTDVGDLVRVNVGIKNEYSGETKKGLWDRFAASALTAHARSNAQVYYADIFIPSVEEAVSMSNYLFKFNGSNKNNAKDIVNNYRRGYFLRTPEYGTTDKVYYVDLVTGRIATTNAVAKSDDDVCEVGIRPAYVVEQYD